MKKSTYRLTVRGYELDSFGHVNNAVYLQYAEAAKWEFFHKSGLMAIMDELNLFPVILENNIRYMHEFKMMDEVRIDSEWYCSKSIMHYKHLMYNETTEMLSCKISGKLIYTNSNRILCDVPEKIKYYLEEMTNDN